jgi:formate C-acetyltransferase
MEGNMDAIASVNDQLKESLDLFAMCFADPGLQSELMGTQGWTNLTVGLTSEDGKVSQAVIIEDGTVTVQGEIPETVETRVIFADEETVLTYLGASGDTLINMLLTGKVRVEGNLILMGFFEYLLNLLADGGAPEETAAPDDGTDEELKKACRTEKAKRRSTRIRGEKKDPGVRYLDDPYFADVDLEDFPRVKAFRTEYFTRRPEVSAEHGKLLTDFFIENGYETKKDGSAWDPNLRKAESFKYLMERKAAMIRENDLIAGSYTENPVFGAVGQPYCYGPFYWGEIRTFHKRALQPYVISEETIQTLHKHVYPFWARRTIQELWKQEFDHPLPAQIHDRFFSIFFWKTVSICQMAPGYDVIVKLGTGGLIRKIREELARDTAADREKIDTLNAMVITLEGVEAYAAHLAEKAAAEAAAEQDAQRKKELEEMAGVLRQVPARPARTLYEAIQSLAIIHICTGLEITDDGPSLGRLDQILQPFFEQDMEKLASTDERASYLQRVLELMGCFFLKIASHEIPSPEIGIWLNSGTPPNTTLVVGGVTPDGRDAVNDMSYIILKVTEMLSLNDPNVHARYKAGVNSDVYLKRTCDVNYITGSTPCIHSDDAMFEALTQNGWAIEDVRDWTPIGCVEPGIMGKHGSATSSLEVNLVAPLEMALNDGVHPLNHWAFGPKTGRIENDDFKTFEDFWKAFETQCLFILEQGVTGNNQLGRIYQEHHPAPLLSAMLEGCIENGRGVIRGGARYNSSGVALTGLADVVDSLMAVKTLVFDEKKVSFQALKKAIDTNFSTDPAIHAMTLSRVPRFGSGNSEALAMARRVTSMAASYHRSQKNYRGGHYATGFWSMSYHSAYGRLTGALPSGRLAGEPFTPGLTPHPGASKNLLDNLRDVAGLDPKTLDNNMAFNVRMVPGVSDTHDQAVTRMAHYAKTYMDQGGMQLQFNVVNTAILKDAMAHPEHYQDLMVRISGYCGYFTRLHPDLQLEVIRRSEYAL